MAPSVREHSWGISWFFLVGPMFFAGSGSAFNLAVSLGYPPGDVAVLFGLNLLALRGVAKPYRLMYLVLTVGMLCYVGADSGHAFGTLQGTYTAGTLSVDGLWLLGALVMALVPLYQLARYRLATIDRAHIANTTNLRAQGLQRLTEQGPLSLLVYVPILITFLLAGSDSIFTGVDERLPPTLACSAESVVE
jgi:hypothetical protein